MSRRRTRPYTNSGVARRWRADQIDNFASKPDLPQADALAAELGGAVELFWNAEKDPNAEDQEPTPAAGLGQPG